MFWSTKTGISSKYSFSSSPTFTCEPWSVYTGRPKSSNSSSSATKVSIFVFDKKRFENFLLNYGIIKSRNSSHDKVIIQEAYDILRNQVGNLAKLKHPNILALVEPLEEHSKNFMFVTEYVTGSLESVFADGNDETSFFKGHVREDVVVQRGILEIAQALDFIHNRASFVHLDLQPRSVFINENSDWKVSGLGHLVKLPQGTNTSEYFLPQYDPRAPSFVRLELNYAAPEIIFDNTISFKSDYYSLGSLIYMLYTGKSLLSTENSTSQYKDEYSKFERKLATMSWDSVFSKLPPNLKPCMSKLMNRDLYSRYDNINEFLESPFFQDPLIKTLNFMDDLPTKTNEEKLVFLKGLEELLPQFPVTLLQRKFLTVLLESLAQLCKDKVPDGSCISKEVELIIRIGSTISQLTFQEKIFPQLTSKANFTIILHNATLALIKNLSILKEKVKKDDFLENLAKPILTYTFHDMQNEESIVAQETLLANLQPIASLFEFITMKNFLIPLISHLFTKTTSLMVKISCVACFSKLIEFENVDSDIICDDILPLFRSMKTRDSRILVQSLKLFRMVPKVVKKDTVLVEQLLPLIWNYSMAPTLSRLQFTQYTTVIRNLSDDIQRTHIETLQESNNNVDETSESKKFDDLIQPVAVKREDLDTQAAKSIDVPAILPTRKPQGSKQSILTRENIAKSSKNHTQFPLQSRGVPRKTPPVTQKPLRTRTTLQKSDDLDDFDDFVSSTPSPVSSSRPNASNGTTSTYGSTQRNTQHKREGENSKSLPPGLSFSLQPSRKSVEPTTTSSSSSTNISMSLI